MQVEDECGPRSFIFLALALRHGDRLATFERTLRHLAPAAERMVMLTPA